MGSTITIALIKVGGIALIAGLLVIVNNRDKKRNLATDPFDSIMNVGHPHKL